MAADAPRVLPTPRAVASPSSSSTFYGADLAAIHDAGFTDWAEAAANVLLAHAPPGTIVDLACGTGALAHAVLRQGRPVVGVDLSGDMLAIARKRAPKATFRQGSLLDAELPDCAAIALVGEAVNFLADGGQHAQRLKRLFRRAHAALRPGGILLLDSAGPGRANHGTTRMWDEGKDWLVAAESRERGLRLTRRILTFRRDEGRAAGWRRGEETHVLRLIEPKRLKQDLEKAGFEVRRLDGYGALRLPKGQTVYVARKPSS